MILSEAYELMDLLLDKSDQPYFTTNEKNKFLNLAISDFINFHYQKMTADEDSRRALAGVIDSNYFLIADPEIQLDQVIYSDTNPTTIDFGYYPAFSAKYNSATGTDIKGHWQYGFEYVLPKQHMYILSISVGYFNIDKVTNPDGTYITGKTIISDELISAKNKSIRDYQELQYSKDPFNKKDYNSPCWAYVKNTIRISPYKGINQVEIKSITLPTVANVFTDQTIGSSTAPIPLSFAEHYQKQIIELAISKMTKVDIGLMTPSTE